MAQLPKPDVPFELSPVIVQSLLLESSRGRHDNVDSGGQSIIHLLYNVNEQSNETNTRKADSCIGIRYDVCLPPGKGGRTQDQDRSLL